VVDTTVKLPVVYTIPPLLVAVFSEGSVGTSVYATLALSVMGWYTVTLVVGGSCDRVSISYFYRACQCLCKHDRRTRRHCRIVCLNQVSTIIRGDFQQKLEA
jgi:hypothetical protein